MSASDPSSPGLPIVGASVTAAAVAAVIVAAFALLTGGEKAQVLGLTQHGALVTAQDAGASDAVALVAVSPGTPGQVLTVSDAGLPHWAAGGGGTTLPDASGAADGAVLATVGGAQTWTQMWPGAVTVEDMTGTGWTTTAGASTSATWSGGVLTLSAASGATGRVEVERASPLSSTAHAWDYAARIDVTAGDTTSGTGYVLLIVASDANNFVYYRLYQDGTTRLLHRIAGADTSLGDVAGPSSGQRTGAQLWLRLRGDVSGRWVALWGEGSSGSLPTVWTRTHAADVAGLTAAVPATSALEIWVGSSGGAPLTATHTADVLDIRSSWSGAL